MTDDTRPKSAGEYWARRKAREARFGRRSLNVRTTASDISRWYCFCGRSSLYDNVCPACGKPPYTD